MDINDRPDTSRRNFISSIGMAFTAAWLSERSLLAQHEGDKLVNLIRGEAATAPIAVQTLRGNVSALMGSGGNIAVFNGPDGKLLVDAGITASRPHIEKALAALSAQPVKHLINTHWHFDHTDGNAWLHDAGATIIAHTNTRKHLSVATRVEDWNFTFERSPRGALPSEVFDTVRTEHVNGSAVALSHYAPAHTDSDIAVHFTDADILHVGDTWWNGVYPFIDRSTGGSIDGMIRATESNLARVGANTIIIPGHGPVGDKAQLTECLDMLVDVRATIARLKKEGKSLDEVLAARPTAAYDAKWGSLIPPNLFARIVFADV